MPAESKFEVYKDNVGKFRWRLRASNDEEIVDMTKQGVCLVDVRSSFFFNANLGL